MQGCQTARDDAATSTILSAAIDVVLVACTAACLAARFPSLQHMNRDAGAAEAGSLWQDRGLARNSAAVLPMSGPAIRKCLIQSGGGLL